MSLPRMIRSAVMRRMADAERHALARAQAERRRLAENRPHEVRFFHQPDDPHSHLALQALPAFLARFNARVLPHVVAQPAPGAIHEQRLWDAWSRGECRTMAPAFDLSAPGDRAPDQAATDLARRILLKAEASADFVELAIATGRALHAGDGRALEAITLRYGALAVGRAQERLHENFSLRHRLGHYLSGMFYYEGEWYWGIDRLHYLESRLEALGVRRPDAPVGPSLAVQRVAAVAPVPGRRLVLEFFPSIRSPYTHLSYGRVSELVRRHPIDLVVRPVLPMMMRGVKADRRKGQYILFDTRREADRLGIPFGNLWDPFGEPVRRAYSLFPWARDQGRGFEYLHEYSKAVWSERIDAMSPRGLRTIVERAGLPWDAARVRLDSRDWEPELERNVQDMIAAGSWGVPTLRLPASRGEAAFTVWGQDRLWLLEDEIVRRLAARG
ncbi:MAG TPA: DsbA family protein [Verrucomicrobiae bacterium]|nr:DsbA family protein [Verrucomicrobiae bacterium]